MKTLHCHLADLGPIDGTYSRLDASTTSSSNRCRFWKAHG